MRKKYTISIIIIIAVLAAVIGLTLFLTDGFTYGKITNRAYNVQNVYDEIWNLMNREETGEETVLSGSTATAKKVYEFGVLAFIRIPECNATLSRRGGLRVSIDTGEFITEETTGRIREKYVVYTYDCRTKTLTLAGTDNEQYIIKSFLSEYFKWLNSAKLKTEYSLENLGDYSIKIEDLGGYVLTK